MTEKSGEALGLRHPLIAVSAAQGGRAEGVQGSDLANAVADLQATVVLSPDTQV